MYYICIHTWGNPGRGIYSVGDDNSDGIDCSSSLYCLGVPLKSFVWISHWDLTNPSIFSVLDISDRLLFPIKFISPFWLACEMVNTLSLIQYGFLSIHYISLLNSSKV